MQLTIEGVHKRIAGDRSTGTGQRCSSDSTESILVTSSDVTHELVHSEMGGMRGSGSENNRRDTAPQRPDAFSDTNGTEVLRERGQRCSHSGADRSSGTAGDGGRREDLHTSLPVSYRIQPPYFTLIESTGKMAACSEIPA